MTAAFTYRTTVTRGSDGQLYLEHTCDACDWPVQTGDLCTHAAEHMGHLHVVSEPSESGGLPSEAER